MAWPNNPGPAPAPRPVPVAGGTITAVEPQARQRDRVNVFVDGAFALGLDAEVAARLGLQVGQQVDAPRLQAAAAMDEECRAIQAALRLLAVRARSRAEIATRLRRRPFAAAAIEAALAYLERQGWVDDEQFAREFARSRLQSADPPGPRRLAHDLARRGVPAPVIQAVLSGLDDADPVSAAVAVARRRLSRMGAPDRQVAWRRLGGYLARRGYDAETVAAALRIVLDETAAGGDGAGPG